MFGGSLCVHLSVVGSPLRKCLTGFPAVVLGGLQVNQDARCPYFIHMLLLYFVSVVAQVCLADFGGQLHRNQAALPIAENADAPLSRTSSCIEASHPLRQHELSQDCSPWCREGLLFHFLLHVSVRVLRLSLCANFMFLPREIWLRDIVTGFSLPRLRLFPSLSSFVL